MVAPSLDSVASITIALLPAGGPMGPCPPPDLGKRPGSGLDGASPAVLSWRAGSAPQEMRAPEGAFLMRVGPR